MEEQDEYVPSVVAAVRAGSLPHLLAAARGDPPEDELTQALKEAVLYGSVDAARIMLAAGAEPHPPDTPLLVLAAKMDNINMLKVLMIEGCEPDQEVGGSALHVAVTKGNQDMVQMLLTGGASTDRLDDHGLTPLMLAVAAGGEAIIKLLLKQANVDAKGGDGKAALHLAAISDDISIMKILLAEGASVNLKDGQGHSPLLLACKVGKMAAMRTLLAAPLVDVNCMTDAGKSCLHMLLGNHVTELVDVLCDAKINCNIRDLGGNSALVAFAAGRREDLALALLEKTGCDTNVKPVTENGTAVRVFDRGEGGRIALHWAASHGQMKLLHVLLDSTKLLQFSEDVKSDTPITLAAKHMHDDVTRVLMAAGSEVTRGGNQGMCVLHWLAHYGTMELLLEALSLPGSHINPRDKKGRTPLYLALLNHQYKMARVLLSEWQPDVTPGSEDEFTALHMLSRRGHTELAKVLLERGCLPDVRDSNGDFPLTLAVSKSHVDTTSCLIEAGACVNVSDGAGRTPLHLAVDKENFQIIHQLMEAKADLNVQDKAGDTPLSLATSKCLLEITVILVKAGCDVNKPGKDGCLALLYPSRVGDIDIVKVLLDAGSHTESQAATVQGARAAPSGDLYSPSSPLIDAVKRGHEEIIKLLLVHGADVNWKDGGQGTALLWGAQKGRLDIVKRLLLCGADAQHKDCHGDTALTLAAWHQQEVVIDLLAPLSELDHAEREEGMSALHLAISKDDVGCVKRLLANGASVNARDRRGNHALLSAAMFTTGPGIIQAILEASQSCNINFQGHLGRAALHWSVNDTHSMGLLVAQQPDLDLVDDNGATPLLLSIAHAQHESSHMLIQAGCDVHKVHQDGRQAVHHAAIYAGTDTLTELLDHGVSPQAPTKEGHTPLLLASIEGNLSCVEALLNHGCSNINMVYFEAITALSVATTNKHYSVMLRLLEAGADPDLIGDLKLRPLLSCVLSGDVPGVALLLQGGAVISRPKEIEAREDHEVEEDEEEPVIGRGVERHPILVAVLRSHYQIASLLGSLECDMGQLRALLNEPVMTLFAHDSDVIVLLRKLCSVPPPLMALARQAIRDQLKPAILAGVAQLPLPAVLREYVRMANLDSLYMDQLHAHTEQSKDKEIAP